MELAAQPSPLAFRYVYVNEVLAIGATLPAVCILVVALRLVMRRVQHQGLKASDWLAVCALFPFVGMGICLIVGACMGNMGYPTPPPPANLTPDQQDYYVDPTTVDNEIIEFVFQILMMTTLGFIKLSLIFFYRQIFVVQKYKGTDIVLIATAVVVVLWTLTFILLIIFPCGSNIWINWSSAAIQSQYCPISLTSEYGLTISDLITDLWIFALPILFVWKLRMTTRRKLAVICVFLLGASAVGTSICRIIIYYQTVSASEAGAVIDTNLNLTLAYYWSTLEAGLALIAACLPPLAHIHTYVKQHPAMFGVPFFQRSWERLRSSISLQSRDQRSTNDATTTSYKAMGTVTEKGNSTTRIVRDADSGRSGSVV